MKRWASLKTILSEPRYSRTAWIVFFAYLLLYLVVTGFVVFSAGGEHLVFGINIASNWQDNIFRMRAPFLFESIGVVYLTEYVAVFLSIPNLILASILSTIVSWNIAVSYYIFRMVGWKGKSGVVSLVGTIPALLGGAVCCVPTLIIVIGLQFTATLATVWAWFVPLSFVLLVASLMWALKQAQENPAICKTPRRKNGKHDASACLPS
jgi:hypothetical protein